MNPYGLQLIKTFFAERKKHYIDERALSDVTGYE